MPYRKEQLITGETYHIFNRSVGGSKLFSDNIACERMINCVDFYRFPNPGIRFSYFSRLPSKRQKDFILSLYQQHPQLDLYAFSLMPNHLHFLVKQSVDGGISRFMRLLLNSFAKYRNTRLRSYGSVFQSMFGVTRIESENQLLHVGRYIHLNPLSSSVLKSIDKLRNYPWNSYVDYLGKPLHDFVNTAMILQNFQSTKEFQKFTENQADYQRSLDQLKHHTPGV